MGRHNGSILLSRRAGRFHGGRFPLANEAATTRELRSYREEVKNALLTLGIFPIEQNCNLNPFALKDIGGKAVEFLGKDGIRVKCGPVAFDVAPYRQE
jgi:hypothetical protein